MEESIYNIEECATEKPSYKREEIYCVSEQGEILWPVSQLYDLTTN